VGFHIFILFILSLIIMFRLIPVLLLCGKESNTLTTQMVSATFVQLNTSIGSETELVLLSSLLSTFAKSVKIVGGPAALSRETHNGLTESLTRQLEILADRRKNRAPLPHEPLAIDFDIFSSDLDNINILKAKFDPAKFDMAAIDMATLDSDEMHEDIETFVLEDMAHLLCYLDPIHPLLANVSSVQSLGRDRGIKRSEELRSSAMAALDKLNALLGGKITSKSEEEKL
jgi:hypothetical protein